MQGRNPENEDALHSADLGVATVEEIEKRAIELAELEDRTPEEVTEEDRMRARQELRGEDVEKDIADEKTTTVETPRDPSETIVHHGKVAPEKKPVEEQKFTEMEVEKGVRAAEHERAVRAHEEQPTGSESTK